MLSATALSSYLNDHLASATGEVAFFQRVASSHAGTDRGPELRRMAQESAVDRDALVELMRRLDVPRGRVPVALGWAAEKLGRLKTNGSLLHRTPATDLVEIDGLRAAVATKLARWQVLRALATQDDRLGRPRVEELEELLERTQTQAQALYEMHLRLAQQVFTGGDGAVDTAGSAAEAAAGTSAGTSARTSAGTAPGTAAGTSGGTSPHEPGGGSALKGDLAQ